MCVFWSSDVVYKSSKLAAQRRENLVLVLHGFCMSQEVSYLEYGKRGRECVCGAGHRIKTYHRGKAPARLASSPVREPEQWWTIGGWHSVGGEHRHAIMKAG